jgi:hypothetical protein
MRAEIHFCFERATETGQKDAATDTSSSRVAAPKMEDYH